MSPAREIIVTVSARYYWARYADHKSVLVDPSGYGSTEEAARKNLAIDEAHLAKRGPLDWGGED